MFSVFVWTPELIDFQRKNPISNLFLANPFGQLILPLGSSTRHISFSLLHFHFLFSIFAQHILFNLQFMNDSVTVREHCAWPFANHKNPKLCTLHHLPSYLLTSMNLLRCSMILCTVVPANRITIRRWAFIDCTDLLFIGHWHKFV